MDESAGAIAPAGIGTSGFSSFNFAGLQSLQQEQAGAKLQAAAARYLESSSSSSSDSEGGSHGDKARHAAHPSKHERRSKKQRHGRDGQEQPLSELDKIMRAEARAAAMQQGRSAGRAALFGTGLGGTSGSAAAGMYYDKRGDKQALVYQSLYAGDIAAFNRKDPLGVARGLRAARRLAGIATSYQPPETGSRYFHAVHAMQERSRKARRLRMAARLQPIPTATVAKRPGLLSRSMPLPEVIPVDVSSERLASGAAASTSGRGGEWGRDGADGDAWVGETVDEYVMRRTRDFNVMTRETPDDVGPWLRFVAFQDEAADLMGTRGAARARAAVMDAAAVAEKKAAILERALSHNRTEPQLLLGLLQAAAPLLDAPTLCTRWEHVISRWRALDTPNCALGTALLWTEYLRMRRNQFALFKVQRLQAVYADALDSIAHEAGRLQRTGGTAGQLLPVEVALVRCTLDLISLELDAGHTEQAVARIQAVLEFHCCNPLLTGGAMPGALGGASHYAQLRLFRSFWLSGAPRIGSEGAEGWLAWYRKQNSDVLVEAGGPSKQGEEPAAEEAQGAWSGWVELPASAAAAAAAGGGEGREGDGAGGEKKDSEEADEGEKEGDVQDEEEEGGELGLTEEELMHQLGLKLEKELEAVRKEGVKAAVLRHWVDQEEDQSRTHSFPAASHPNHDTDHDPGTAQEGQYVDLEDIEEVLKPLSTTTALELLVLGSLALLGAPVGSAWASSNQPLLLHGSPPLIDPLLQQLLGSAGAAASTSGFLPPMGPASLDDPTPAPWYSQSEERHALVARMLRTLTGPGMLFEEHPAALSAYLLVEATSVSSSPSGPNMQLGNMERARAAAKGLLAAQRSNLAAWGTFAQVEAWTGAYKAARNIYEVTLAASSGLPQAMREQHLPGVVLDFAQAELARGGGPDAAARAFHALAWFLGRLGSKPVSYQALNTASYAPTAATLMAARKGFNAALPQVAAACASGSVSASGARTVVAAGLLELLAEQLLPGAGAGMSSALAIFKNTAGVPRADVHGKSPHYEWLQVNFCCLLVRAMAAPDTHVPPAAVHKLLLQALSVFPSSGPLVQLLVVMEGRAHATSRLRQYLHTSLPAHPTERLLLLSASWEAARAVSTYMVRNVLERAAAIKALASCAALWVMYLRFELRLGDAASVRKVFLRAIRECPGSKAVWMEGFGAAAQHEGVLRPHEASELIAAMEEKGLRVHVDVMEAAMQCMTDMSID